LSFKSAYDTLSDEDERRCYDTWLDSLLPLSYEEFKRNRDAVKMSMHWITPKETPMISSSSAGTQEKSMEPETKSPLRWESAYSLDGLVVVALLIICSCAYLKRVPRINSWLLSEKKGFFGIFYKV
ncbi:hypothetical protein COOONC_18824, partial [Cooperia oncophora]